MNRIEQRKENWMKFMDLSSDLRRMMVITCYEGVPSRPLLWWDNAEIRVEWSYQRYLKLMEQTEWLEDNTIPYLSMITGTEIFAEAFGCKVYRPLDNNPFALPMIHSAKEAASIKIPRLEDTKLTLLFDMADKLRDRAGKEALFNLPDMQTPMDVVALIWAKEDLFLALYDEPDAVRELAQKVKAFQTEFIDRWQERYGTQTIAHYPDYYLPQGITMSEDEVGTVSTEMYREFFQEELHQLSHRYTRIGVHCCADSIHQWENFSKIPNLCLLNLCQPAPVLRQAVEFFQDKVALYLPTDYNILTEPIPEKAHVAQYVDVATKEEALALLERFYTLQ